MIRHYGRVGIAVGLIGLMGCNERTIQTPKPQPIAAIQKKIPQNANKELDILFVVDDSQSMAPVQGNLLCNFPNFINVLRNLEDGLPSLHLGITTTNNGAGAFTSSLAGSETRCHIPDEGRLVRQRRTNLDPGIPHRAVCDTSVINTSDAFIKDVLDPNAPGGRSKNYSGDISDVFGCLAEVGTTGCGFEAVLGSARAALSPIQQGGGAVRNPGFIRENAFLAIIFITNEDDCSVPPTSRLFDPSPQAEAQLGPFLSFRCTEYGIVCNGQRVTRAQGQAPLQGCTSGDSIAQSDPDHALEPVANFIDFFSKIKPPGKLIMAAVAAPTTPFQVGPGLSPGQAALVPSCGSPFVPSGMCTGMPQTVIGDPAVRLKQVIDAVGGSVGIPGTFEGICQESYENSMREIAEKISRALGGACVDEQISSKASNYESPITAADFVHNGKVVNPAAISCTVEDILNAGRPNQAVDQAIPACNPDGEPANKTCWAMMVDSTCDADPAKGVAIQICRNGFNPDMTSTGMGPVRPKPCLDGPNMAKDGTTAVVNCATVPRR